MDIASLLPMTTPRLSLRLFTPGDVDDLYAYQSLPSVARYLYRRRTRGSAASRLRPSARRNRFGAPTGTSWRLLCADAMSPAFLAR